jgi:arsenate reductase (thioredoxin)
MVLMMEPLKVLVLCTANSARSQMAEGLLRAMAGDRVVVHSAGTKATAVNPYAVRAMADAGIDISDHYSKKLDRFLDQPFDYVITVCDHAAEQCPMFPGKAQRIHWGLNDPAAVDGDDDEKLQAFILVRDRLRELFANWLTDLGVEFKA